MAKRFYLYIPPLVAVLIWSVNMVVIKYAVGTTDPFTINFYRWILALIIMLVVFHKQIIINLSKIIKYLPQFFILGLLGMTAYQGIAYVAAKYTSASHLGIICGVSPLISVVLISIVQRQFPSMVKSVGCILTIIGLGYFISKGNVYSIINEGFSYGDTLMLLAVFCYSLYGVCLKKFNLPFSISINLTMQIVFAVILQLPVAYFHPVEAITLANSWVIVFSAILPSIIGTFLWVKGVENIGADKCSGIFCLLPVFISIIAVFTLGDPWGAANTVGIIIMVIGLLLINRKIKKNQG
ncbi:TPA: DMT family transporter [Raoultella ornithinolytica]|nr:DMT family transporter [Raoultella ornithinolytica]HAT1671165.1 DMT family transporter [Raoultella ornithinolytica]